MADAQDNKPHQESAQGEQSSPQQQQQQKPEEKNKGKWYQRPALVGALILTAIVLVVGGVFLWLYARTYEYTDDAFVDAHTEFASPLVSGRVLRVLADDNEDVNPGDLLVEIDPADYQSRLDAARAAEAEAHSKLEQAQAQVSVSAAQLEQQSAAVAVSEANATNAASDLQRFAELLKKNPGAVSQQQMDNIAAAAKSTAAQLMVAQKTVTAAQAQTTYAQSEVSAAEAGVKDAEAQTAQAKLNLSYTQVHATIEGRVAMKKVTPGNFVQPGTVLLAIVPHAVYITANFKETQLNLMRAGQQAEITVDSFPDLELHGRVNSVQPGSGQVFSVLPAENATGNWVKVVQRVPVKIILDRLPSDPARLAPGMSAEVTVSVR